MAADRATATPETTERGIEASSAAHPFWQARRATSRYDDTSPSMLGLRDASSALCHGREVGVCVLPGLRPVGLVTSAVCTGHAVESAPVRPSRRGTCDGLRGRRFGSVNSAAPGNSPATQGRPNVRGHRTQKGRLSPPLPGLLVPVASELVARTAGHFAAGQTMFVLPLP